MLSEQWLPVPGYAPYEASSLGRVRNGRTGRVLKPQLHDKGYLKVHLGRRRYEYVHRIVCETFHGPPPLITDHADHDDFDPTNNTPGNLKWLRASHNSGRKPIWTPQGWVRPEDAEVDDEPPMSDDERERIDKLIDSHGW